MLTGSQGSTKSCIAVRSSAASQDGRQIEPSYASELQWAGQNKRDTVACEVLHYIQVARGKGHGGKEGKVRHTNGTQLPEFLKI